MRVLVLNGPNLNLLGTREPDVYGDTTLRDLEKLIQTWGAALGMETRVTQSNHEGELVDAIHRADGVDGLVINPGALTHTSRSIGDAITSVGLPAVEVHISNVRQREPWRVTSMVAPSCVRTIFGRGTEGYQDALRHLQNRAATPFDTVAYGPHRENVGDIRRPGDEASGIIIMIHGGLWRQEYERDSTETLAVDLTGRGYVTWNIEYRRGEEGGWPGSAHDVVSAFDFIVREMPGVPVGIVGHSAGGHLGL
ncbi:MAG: type II 3-dehydroquinate dehydratase, partial [Acidimicrobiia bacterium]